MSRKLYLLSGIQGSGKDTFLKESNLDMFSISMDELRKIHFSPDLNKKGDFVINNKNNEFIYKELISIIKRRMINGEVIILNNTNIDAKQISEYDSLAKKYNYEVEVVDFKLEPIEVYLERNKKRPKLNQLNEDIIRNYYAKKEKLIYPAGISVISKEDLVEKLYRSPEELAIDVQNYNNVHFFGDLQGCAKTVLNFLKDQTKYNEDLYIFTGDYIDRGEENAVVLNMIEKFGDSNNFIFLKGNHDENLYKYLLRNQGENIRLPEEFELNTLPELINKGYDDERINNIYKKLKDYSILKLKDKLIFVNHGGIGFVPDYPNLLSKEIYLYGAGNFSDDIDLEFNENSKNNELQIHGHRNIQNNPIINGKSINLEGGIEYGGDLRVLTLNTKSAIMTPHYIQNKYYRKGMLKMGEVELSFNNKAEFDYQKNISDENVAELVSSLRKHPLIKESVYSENNNISSFNFTKEAFFNDKKENYFSEEIVSHARGLFINTNSNKIIGRGFEKFFNLNEKEETKKENIAENYTFPITLYQKENGFFGLIAYDEEKDELLFTSKSRIEGEFPDYFRNIALKTFSEDDLNRLKRYAQKYEVNFIFEVIDIHNDPHIVHYDDDTIVLLDIVKRDISFQNVEFESLKKFTEQFDNLKCKELFCTFNNPEAFQGFLNSFENGNRFKHEGFVVEDSKGKKFKLKTPYYNAWKLLRGQVQHYHRKTKKLQSVIDTTKNKGLKEGAIKELNSFPNSIMVSFGDKLKNIGVNDAVLKNQVISCFQKVINGQDQDLSMKSFYDLKTEFLRNDAENKPTQNKKFKM